MTEQHLTGYPSIDKPWLKYYSADVLEAPLPECTIYEYLYNNNRSHPNDIAIIYYGKKITYKTLFDNIDYCAKALLRKGVKENDIVTVAMPSIPEAIYAVYAINKIGAVANMIHPLAGENEIVDYLNEVNSSMLLMFNGTYDIVGTALQRTKVQHAVVASPSDSLPLGLKQLYRIKAKETPLPSNSMFMNWEQFMKLGKHGETVQYHRSCDRVSLISHTGGTTGVPKGVMLTDRSVNAIICQIGMIPHDRQERMLIVLPPFVNYSLVNGIFEALAFGFSVVLIPKYEPDKFNEYVAKYQPNHINSIPTYLEAMLENQRLSSMDLSCLKVIASGGDGLNEKKEAEINEFLRQRGVKDDVIKGLGSTEMVSCATISYGECNRIGSVGIPLPHCNCKIVEPGTENELSYNHEGELCFTGVSLMVGYYGKPEATDEVIKIHADGKRWLHTGDLGYMTEDGIIYISGRIKRIIITRGNDGMATKMFPDRIEKSLLRHPAVDLCCVVGIPDEERIHTPKAFVVLKDGYVFSTQLETEITEVCREALPTYMIPTSIEFRNDLPRTDRGKVDFRKLEEMAAQVTAK